MKRQSGAAVIVAMLVVALATIVASDFMYRTHVQWRKLENAATADQAGWLLRAAEQWGAAILLDDALRNNVDHLGEIWSREVPPLTAEGYQLTGRIVEQNGRFNLNGLARGGKIDESQLAIFRRLLRHLNLPETLAGPVADLSFGRPIVNLEELLAVREMTPERLARLRPYVTFLPQASPLNINTAAVETIAALAEGMTLDQAQVLVDKRNRSHFREMQEVRDVLGERTLFDPGQVAFASRYFLVIVQARRDRVALESRVLFERNGRQFPRLVWRTIG